MLSNGSSQTLVVDTSPLIYLAKIDALDLFTADAPAHITESVRSEAILPQAAYRFPEIVAIDDALRKGTIRVVTLRTDEAEAVVDIARRVPGLGSGERESIAFAQLRGRSVVLFDRGADRIAQAMGVHGVGITDLLFARTDDDDLLESRIRRFAHLVDMRTAALEQLMERAKERSRW